MMNPVLHESLIREHQHTMRRIEDETRREQEARRAISPQPQQPQPTKHPHPACLPQPAIGVRR